MTSWLFILGLLISSSVFADRITFPEEELAAESVLPIFEKPDTVLNRNILTKGRFELGLGGGLALNDAFYNPLNYGLTASYHFNETHGVQLVGQFFADGLSTYGLQLQRGEGLSGDRFDPSLAPSPNSVFLANYQLTAFYGKISLTKQTVANLTLHGLLGAGVVQMDGVSPVAINVGFGQKFYFTKWLALRIDLSMLIFQGPDPTSRRLNDRDSGFTRPTAADFDNKIFFNRQLNTYLVFLL